MYQKCLAFLITTLWILSAQAGALTDFAKKRFEKVENRVSVTVYELKNESYLFEPASVPLKAVSKFQEQVIQKADTDPKNPYALIERQSALFKSYGQLDFLHKFDQALKQKIYDVSYLEEMLLELQEEKLARPLFGSYSEFGAHILVGPKNQLIVVFVSNPHDAMVPSLRATTEQIMAYLKKGYQYFTFIHNHPFNFENPYDIGGTTVPSGTLDYGDVSAFIWNREKHGLQNAWITNGFSTIRIPAVDFEKY